MGLEGVFYGTKHATTRPLTRARLKTPLAAAIAGILFSVLLTTTLVLIRISVPAISPEIRRCSVEQPLCRLVAPGVSSMGARIKHIHSG
jgi:hypothetical protein